MGAIEHVHIPQHPGELREQLGAGSAEGAGRDIRIAERQHGDPPTPQGLHDRYAAAGELLSVVDEHHAQRCQRAESRRIGRVQDGARLAEQVGGIAMCGSEGVEHGSVLHEELRRRRPHGVARCTKLRSVHPELGALGEESAQLGAESLRRPNRRAQALRPRDAHVLRVTGEELGDDAVLIRARQQRRRLGPFLHHRPPHELEGERAERSRERTRRGLPDPDSDPVAQRRRRLTVRGEGEHLFGAQGVCIEKVDDAVDEGAGLPRSRCADDDTGRVRLRGDHSTLSGIRCHDINAIRTRGHHRPHPPEAARSHGAFPLCAHGETGRDGRSRPVLPG